MMCRIKSLHRHEVRKGLKGSRSARIEDGQVKPQLNTDHQGGSHTDSTVFIVQRRATVITAFGAKSGRDRKHGTVGLTEDRQTDERR